MKKTYESIKLNSYEEMWPKYVWDEELEKKAYDYCLATYYLSIHENKITRENSQGIEMLF